jgi:hypothetical protein
MKKAIILISVLCVMTLGVLAQKYYWGQVDYKVFPATATDTIGPFPLEGYDEAHIWTSMTETGSATITMTLTPMSKHKGNVLKDIGAAATVINAATASDDDIVYQIRGNDSAKFNVKAPIIWLKRVVTITGDTFALRQAVFAK